MITVDTIHKLSNAQTSILQNLIGKSLTEISCSGVDLTLGKAYYDFIDTINLKLQGIKEYISISATFDETNFGDDFIKIDIKKEKHAIGVKRHELGGLQHPFVSLNIYPEFIIKKIEIYGDSYVCQSDNNKEERYWKIEIENPGIPITENIEIENVIIFYSDNGRLLVGPYGPIPWIQVTSDSKSIDASLVAKKSDGKKITKLKYTLK